MDETVKKKKKFIERLPRVSLILEVAIFFVLGLLITGVISYAILKRQYNETVKTEKEQYAGYVVIDVLKSIARYPAADWLLDYWWVHASELDPEYVGARFSDTQSTINKTLELRKNHPELLIEHAEVEQVEALSPAEQKSYAEIIYNRVKTDIDYTMAINESREMMLVVVDPEQKGVRAMFCGAMGYMDEVGEYKLPKLYFLGDPVPFTEEQIADMMKTAELEEGYSTTSSDGMLRYYYYLTKLDTGETLIFCESYDLDAYLARIKTDTKEGTFTQILFQLLLSVICLLLLTIFILRPIRKTRNGIRKYTSDKDCDAVLEQLRKIRTHNEIGDLRDDLSDMIYEMDQYMKEIREKTAEKERIGTELSVARKIQADVLPKNFPAFPDRKEFDIRATMTPAKEVGGDFYDFFLIDPDHLALVIADVSGKGVPAALFMMISRTLLRSLAMKGGTPAEILGELNHQLCTENAAEMFVTVWFAILELSTGRGMAANAGHEHPALRRKDGSFELVKYKHSPAVATMDGIPFREHEFLLEPGDRLYVYTDGVTEATDHEKELFGDARLLAALSGAKDADLEGLLEHVKEEIDAFVGKEEQFDDITMLALDYYGTPIAP